MNQERETGDLFAVSAEAARARIEAVLSGGGRLAVAVTLTRNRRSMASVRCRPDGEVRVRLHEAFGTAPDAVLRALRTYLRTGRRSAWRVVSDFALNISVPERKAVERPRAVPARSRGQVFDLTAVLAEVNETFFQGTLRCHIRWGRRAAARPIGARRSICFGSWDETTRLIRVNPLLDDARVDPAFLRYIVFHEALHGVVPVEVRGGRRYRHGPHFRHFERQYPALPRMRRLGRELLRVL